MVHCFYLFRHMVAPLRLHPDTVLLIQIPMDYLGQLAVSVFVLRLSMLSAFADNVWNTVSSAALHFLHIGETSDLSILAFITFVRRDWSCAAVIRPLVAFFSSPFLNHSQVLLLATSSVHLRNRPWSGFTVNLVFFPLFFDSCFSVDLTSCISAQLFLL